MINYLRHLYSMETLCDGFEKRVIDDWFKDGKTGKIMSKPSNILYRWTPSYEQYWTIIRGVVGICDMLGIEYLEKNRRIILDDVSLLHSPNSISTFSQFKDCVNEVKDCFEMVKKEVRDKLKLLDPEEMDRLDEAINCYLEGCNYAAVAMSVSAIEFRLLNLMQSVKPNPQLEKYTLGQLIDEYLKNKEEYKKIIPKEHEDLLNLSNTYRIFSVHPKRKKNYQTNSHINHQHDIHIPSRRRTEEESRNQAAEKVGKHLGYQASDSWGVAEGTFEER